LIVQVAGVPTFIDVGQPPVPAAPPQAIAIGFVPAVQLAVSVTLLPLGPVDGLALSEQPDGATTLLVQLTVCESTAELLPVTV
jgi:hypothetical protein